MTLQQAEHTPRAPRGRSRTLPATTTRLPPSSTGSINPRNCCAASEDPDASWAEKLHWEVAPDVPGTWYSSAASENSSGAWKAGSEASAGHSPARKLPQAATAFEVLATEAYLADFCELLE